MSHGGKGDKPRPIVIPKEEYDRRWDEIFNKPKPEPKETESGTDKVS